MKIALHNGFKIFTLLYFCTIFIVNGCGGKVDFKDMSPAEKMKAMESGGEVIHDHDLFLVCYNGRERSDDVYATLRARPDWAKEVYEAGKPYRKAPNPLTAKIFIPLASRSDLVNWLTEYVSNGSLDGIDLILARGKFAEEIYDNRLMLSSVIAGHAIEYHDLRVLNKLLANGADINHIDLSGKTLLQEAIDCGKVALVADLKKMGAK